MSSYAFCQQVLDLTLEKSDKVSLLLVVLTKIFFCDFKVQDTNEFVQVLKFSPSWI